MYNYWKEVWVALYMEKILNNMAIFLKLESSLRLLVTNKYMVNHPVIFLGG